MLCALDETQANRYGIGGIAGPMLSGGLWDALGSYKWAFIPAGIPTGAACLLAMILAILLRPPKEESVKAP